MAAVFVFCEAVKESFSQRLERDLYWYDIEAKEMKVFKGAALSYAYAYDPLANDYRLLPKAEQSESNVVRTVYRVDTIESWFGEFAADRMHTAIDLVETNAHEGWVEFDVPEPEMPEFVNELVESGFDYQVNR